MRRVVIAVGTLATMATVACAPAPDGIHADAVSREPAWCQVQAVLEAKCQRCHVEPPKNGAPFPLLTYDDTQVLNRAQAPRFQRIQDAVASGYMPATWVKLDPPVEALTDNELAVIVDWASAGGQATGGLACSP